MNNQEIDKFIEEVEQEKKRLAGCGWQVQDDSFIMRAIKIIKAAMGKCKECRFWQATKELVCDDNQKACMCPKIRGNVDGMDREDADDKEVLADATACCRGGNLMTRPDFGCVCFEALS